MSSLGTPSAPTFTRRASSLEPSPASTFGGSAFSDTSDDTPRTPGDDVILKQLSNLVVDNSKGAERYSPPFVRNSAQAKAEDPFTSPIPQHRSGQRTPTGPKVRGRSAKSDNWRSSSFSASESTPHSPSTAQMLGSAQSGHGVFAQEYMSADRELRTTEPVIIKSEDAQAIFPPSSCVFVANLLTSEGDEALEVAVTQIFREFGIVYVKIRRDAKHMPFAFCQYTNDDDAERAIKLGRGRLIKGRPCRCEKAKAHRLFFFERKYGTAVSPSEVENILRGFGRISYCRNVTPIERANYNLNDGVMVQFEMYDEGQAALQAYRSHDEFKMQCMANMGTIARQGRLTTSDPAARQYLDTYEVDKRSVFIGNLPADVTEGELQEIFQRFGEIVNVTLHKNDSTVDVNQKHCFAFVEFQNQPSVSRALTTMSGFALGDRAIRVAQKDTEAAKSRTRRQPPRAAPASVGLYQSPAARPMGLQQVSPVTHLPPPQYTSPCAYSQGGQYINYPGTGFAGYGQYPNYSPSYSAYSPYSSPTYAYSSSSSYNTGATSAMSIASSPTQSQFFYGYPQYASPASSYWLDSSPVAPQHVPFTHPPAYSPPSTANIILPDDRSATPTPAGHTSTAADSSLESE